MLIVALGSTAVLRGGSGFIDEFARDEAWSAFKRWQARTRFGLGTELLA
jgi:hypothetical protein